MHEPGSHIVSSGALATLSGAKTGRTPKDKRVVREPASENDIWCVSSLQITLASSRIACSVVRTASVSQSWLKF